MPDNNLPTARQALEAQVQVYESLQTGMSFRFNSLFRRMHPVNGPLDVLQMRSVRNQVAPFMTNNQQKIGLIQQLHWYREVYRKEYPHSLQAWLLKSHGMTIGYGIISYRYGKWWLSGGLLAAYRGLGNGHYLFSQLTSIAATRSDDSRVWLEVWESNLSARRLYEKIGFGIVHREGKKLIMMHKAGAKKIKVKGA
jgi:GNAT superfamily N-acetyltransferase